MKYKVIDGKGIIPDGTNEIAESAFKGCTRLQSIVIPGSVTVIGSEAFSGCSSLQSIVIPDSVTRINYSAFSGCNNLTSIIVSKNNSRYKSTNNCILTKDGKKLILCRSHNIPDSVTMIGDWAFKGCTSLQSIIIPDRVTSIGWAAFWGCTSLQSIVIPDSVKEIGESAFSYCTSLQSIEIPDSVTKIKSHAFEGCTSLQSIVIPDRVTTIDRTAFIACNNLTSIIVSKNNPEYKSTNNCMLTKDGKELILCRSHNIPDGVTKIGRWAFDGCTSLQSIVIPDSVTTIAHNAFCDCISLQSITIATQEKRPDMSREKIEYLLQELSEYLKEISLRVPIGCGYAYRHHTAFEGKFKNIIADIDA